MIENVLRSDVWDKDDIENALKIRGPILIIGGSGFIGSKLFFSLNNLRDDVFACSRNPLQSWRLRDVPREKLIHMDVTDLENAKHVINKIKPLTVFNLSAYGAYSRQTDPERIHLTNYIGTLNIIRALADTGCSSFVQAGTSSEYGLNSDMPKESDELIPNSDYAVSKVGASYIVKYYGKVHNFAGVNLRIYSAYGPWEERDRFIPTLVMNGLRGKYPNFVDKDISRDFVYIDDCTRALVKSALTICRTDPGISVNIATGIKTTIEDAAKTAKKVFDIKEEPLYRSMANRKWDLSDWTGRTDLAKKLMDWTHKTGFEQGLRLTAEWEKRSANSFSHVFLPKTEKKLSVVIACYKDNLSIPVLYERLIAVFKEHGIDYEIIFVNDSSPYADEEAIKEICRSDSHVIGISHSRNFGSQASFVSGMEIAGGDAVVLMDGDGQDPPEVIPDMIAKWEAGYQIVYGQRIKRQAPIFMQIAYKAFYRLFRMLSDIDIPVDAGDFSLIDRKAVTQILKMSEKDIFLRGLRAWVGFKQTGVPYYRPERLFGKTTNSFFKNMWWAKKGIFSFSTKPLHYIQGLGLFTFTVAVALAIFYTVNYFINPSDAKGVTTTVLLILGIGSIQLISISILGDYIGKITEEVKSRPKFIRSRILYNGKVYDGTDGIDKIISRTNL